MTPAKLYRQTRVMRTRQQHAECTKKKLSEPYRQGSFRLSKSLQHQLSAFVLRLGADPAPVWIKESFHADAEVEGNTRKYRRVRGHIVSAAGAVEDCCLPVLHL